MRKMIAIWIIVCLLVSLLFAALAETDGQGIDITVNGIPIEEVIDTASGMFADAVEENMSEMIDGLNDVFSEFAQGFSESLEEIEDALQPSAAPAEFDTKVVYFCFSNSGSSTYEIYSYEIAKDEETGELMVNYELHCGNETYALPAEGDLLQQLQSLIDQHELGKWDGFNKSDSMVLDGSGFSLNATFADGSGITAHGSNSFPDGFIEVKDTIDELFISYLKKNGITPNL